MKETIKAVTFRLNCKLQLLSYVKNIESDPAKWNSAERYSRHLVILEELRSDVKKLNAELNILYEKEKASEAR